MTVKIPDWGPDAIQRVAVPTKVSRDVTILCNAASWEFVSSPFLLTFRRRRRQCIRTGGSYEVGMNGH